MFTTHYAWLFAVLVTVSGPDYLFAQTEIPKPPQSTPTVKFVDNEAVQHELELTKQQLQEIRDAHRETMEEIGQLRVEQLEARRGGEEYLPVDEYHKAVKSLMAESEDKISQDVLVGFQAKRMNQIRWRLELRRLGVDRLLKIDSVSSFFGMTAQEKKKFETTVAKERAFYAKEAEKLRIEMERKLLEAMPARCQANLELLLGEELETDQKTMDK